MKSALFAIAALIGSQSFAAAPLSVWNSPDALIHNLEAAGNMQLTAEQVVEVTKIWNERERKSLVHTVADDDMEISSLTCVGMKAAIFVKGEAAICSPIDGSKSYMLAGWGFGLAAGAGLRVFEVVVIHSPGQSIRGVYIGASVEATGKGARLFDKSFQPGRFWGNVTLGGGFFKGSQGRAMGVFGATAGAIIDVSGAQLTLY